MAKQVKKRGFIGRSVSYFVDVRKWSNLDDIVDNARFVKKSIKDLCYPQQEGSVKTVNFVEMMQKLNLSNEDIEKRKKYFLYYFLVYFFSAIGLFFYTGYLIAFSGRILSVFVTLVLAILMAVYAFREHFWYMQLKTRRLGCGFKDWLAFLFGGTKKCV